MHKAFLTVCLIAVFFHGCSSPHESQLNGAPAEPSSSDLTVPETTQMPPEFDAPSTKLESAQSVKQPVRTSATLSEVQRALELAKSLERDSLHISNESRCGWGRESIAHVELVRDEVTPWRRREEKLRDLLIAIKGRAQGNETGMLRVALAAENLGLADVWLLDSIDAAAFSEPLRAKIYLRGARAALDRAERIVSGRFRVDPDDPEKAIITIPDYIEKADAET